MAEANMTPVDLAGVEHHPAHKLNVEMALAERTFCRFANDREGFNHNVVQGCPLLHSFAKFVRFGDQRFVGQRLDCAFQRVDGIDIALKLLDDTLIYASKQAFSERAETEHSVFLR